MYGVIMERGPVGPPLDAEAILAATEDVLRRYGPSKATVLDVARVLNVSHASVYRHFPSKVALREAVTGRWLARGMDELAAIAHDTQLAPPDRLRAWLTALFVGKRDRLVEDPELFATYRLLVTERSAVSVGHVADITGQLRDIIADGMASGDFVAGDPDLAARVVFVATTRFHHPAHAAEWQSPGMDDDLSALCTLIVRGLACDKF
jgi:AcrR family transcriptional regulator